MRKLILTSLLIILAAWFIGFVCFVKAIYSYPLDDNTHTEAIIALTGGRNRIAEAVRLLNDNKSERLFISGVAKDTSLRLIEKQNNINIRNDEQVSIGKEATNTIGNALETKSWIDRNHIKSIRLVTSNYHLPRSSIEFRSVDPELKIIEHPVYSEKIRKKWWKSWHTFSLIFAEYNKFLYVYIRSRFQ